jgi:RimJ/RimL family protein N-acetyltransferase
MKTAITKDCEDNNDSGVHPLIIRKLTQMDAPLVQAQWNQHTSSSSKNHKPLEEVARLIQNSKMCFGSFVVDNDDEGHNNDSLILCGFILQYDNGVIGMLHVEPEYRRRGHATALLEKSTHALFQERKATTITRNDAFSGVAYIMDGNDASEAVFSKLGWVKEDPTIRKKTGNRRAKRKWILLNQDTVTSSLNETTPQLSTSS